MKRIKVLFIHHHGTLGGASRSLAYLIKNFPPETVDPYIITPAGSATEFFKTVSNNIIEVKELPEITSIAGGRLYLARLIKTLLNLKNLSGLRRTIKKINPDIIHLNEISLVLIAKLCKQLGFKVVMHARVVLSDEEQMLNRIIMKMAQRYVDRVICIDGSVQQKLGSIHSTIVYNPLHISSDEAPMQKRESDETCNVLFLANLIAYKGLFDLLDAAVILREDERIKILVAGSNSRPAAFFRTFLGKVLDLLGIVQDNEKRMKSIIGRHNLANIVYLGHIKNINEWLLKTDILVFPSHMDGPSRSVFEAGALGIPSIIALRNRVEDVVINNKNGIIIPEKSPRQLAEAIKRLSDNRQLREAYGEEARRHFRKLNDPRTSASKVLEVYRELVNADQ